MKSLNPWMLLQAWCHVAPLAMVQAAPRPDPVLAPDALAEAQPAPEPKVIPAVPVAMAWLGSIGGVLGIISFTESYLTRLVEAIKKAANPHHDEEKGDPSWVVGVQVGLDGHGLNTAISFSSTIENESALANLAQSREKGAAGDFPQFCLWNNHGQLLGYNDQTIRINRVDLLRGGYSFHPNENPRPKDMPYIFSGDLKTVGIWPTPEKHSLSNNQAVYVTMVKRHFNPICIASVYVQWPDESRWVFDGTWARASNMSWYYGYVYDSDSRQQECFWLDHTGSLKGEEIDWIWDNVHDKSPTTYIPRWTSPKTPDWVVPPKITVDNWGPSVIPEAGIPEGDLLTEGMKKNGVADYKVAMGVKWHVPALKAGKYGDNIDNLTLDDFTLNPAKMNWITSPSRRSVRGGNPVLPILHPQTNLSEKNPDLIWEDEYNQHIPDHCLTDWYYDALNWWIPPGSGKRCQVAKGYDGKDVVDCRDGHLPIESRAVDDPAVKLPGPPLHERYARTLINDKNKRGGSGTKELCESPHSVGPSYANHQERVFCRMTDKTLWPFCDSATGVSHDCFDAEAEVLVEKTRPIGKRTLYWDAIEDWHSNDRFRRAA